jgi:hypothetical protein
MTDAADTIAQATLASCAAPRSRTRPGVAPISAEPTDARLSLMKMDNANPNDLSSALHKAARRLSRPHHAIASDRVVPC